MIRSLAAAFAVAVCPVGAASAQCLVSSGVATPMSSDTTGFPAYDEGYSAELPLGFAFAIGGATYTHVVIDSNTELYLTDGTAGLGLLSYAENVEANIAPSQFGTSSLAALRADPLLGTARIVCHGGDCEGWAPSSAVLVDDSVPGEFSVTWRDWSEYQAFESWDVSCTLFATGEVRIAWSTGHTPSSADILGVSAGFAVGTGGELASDLSAGGDSGGLPLVFENGWSPGAFDLENSAVTFTPNGAGGYGFGVTCQLDPAAHTPFGAGCYETLGQSVYEVFSTPSVASSVLDGNGVRFVPGAGGYDVTWVPGAAASFVPPSAAAVPQVLSGDGFSIYVPSTPVPTSAGPAVQWTISANGILDAGVVANNEFDATPTGAELVDEAAPNVGFYLWRDFDPTEAGSGPIVVEEVGDLVLVTWDGVEAPPAGVANPSTFQFQMDRVTGEVLLVVVALDAVHPDDETLVGATTSGEGDDPGPITLATGLPARIDEGSPAMGMTASPAPVSTVAAGTTVDYAITDIPDANVNSGIYFGVNVISLGGDVAGTDLTFLGMPGCTLHIASIDVPVAFVGNGPNQVSQFAIPAGVQPGTRLYAQAAALVFPGSLPNGQNAFGAVLSNAVESYISSF